MKLYFLPGLGFDERIFQKLALPDFEKVYLNWIEPEPKESFSAYARRMAQKIPFSEEKLMMVGHSLGGMLCQEIASFQKVDTIILLSSIQSRAELPHHFRAIQPLHLHTIFTKSFTLRTFPLWAKKHDYTTVEEQNLFKSMVEQQSDTYLQWALQALSNWQAPSLFASTRIVQIHGTNDQTFPIQRIEKPDFVLDNAGHFMVYKEAEKISKIIVDTLTK